MNAKRQAVLFRCQWGLESKVAAGPASLQLLDGVAHDGGVTEEVWPAEQGLAGGPPHEAAGKQKSKGCNQVCVGNGKHKKSNCASA